MRFEGHLAVQCHAAAAPETSDFLQAQFKRCIFWSLGMIMYHPCLIHLPWKKCPDGTGGTQLGHYWGRAKQR